MRSSSYGPKSYNVSAVDSPSPDQTYKARRLKTDKHFLVYLFLGYSTIGIATGMGKYNHVEGD